MDSKKKKSNIKEQENSDQAWARNRLQNEIQYLLDMGKIKEAKVLKKQLAELIKAQKHKK
jgi:hypothetical protein